MKKRKERRECQARIVLGGDVSKFWAKCKIRYYGTCCKDCEKYEECVGICSKLLDTAVEDSRCPYYLTIAEAILKRLSVSHD